MNREKPSYDPAYFPSYIYIPKNTKEVQYKAQVNALKIFNPEGEAITTKLISTSAGSFELRSFEVAPILLENSGKAVIFGNYNYQFLNIPDRLFSTDKKNDFVFLFFKAPGIISYLHEPSSIDFLASSTGNPFPSEFLDKSGYVIQ
jgi:hypothetical protein